MAPCTADDLSNLQESSAKVEAKAAEFKEQAAGIHTFIHIGILPHWIVIRKGHAFIERFQEFILWYLWKWLADIMIFILFWTIILWISVPTVISNHSLQCRGTGRTGRGRRRTRGG